MMKGKRLSVARGIMDLRFDVTVTAKDLYRFNLKNIYTSFQGILSFICAALVVFVLMWKFDKLSPLYIVLFIALALLFLVYIPVSLYFRSKQTVLKNEVFKHPLTFTINEEGISVSSPAMTEEDETLLPWDSVYRVVSNKKTILIYSSRVNAYIIPKNQIEDVLSDLTKALKDNVDSFKLHGVN